MKTWEYLGQPFRIIRLGGYVYSIQVPMSDLGWRTIAQVSVNRCTARTQNYKVTMSDNGDVIFSFPSVIKAAESAVRNMRPILDFSI